MALRRRHTRQCFDIANLACSTRANAARAWLGSIGPGVRTSAYLLRRYGRTIALTGSQFAVLIGTAYRQGKEGVSIRALADHVQLAPTHVTTVVGRLVRKGLLTKRANERDRRSVSIRLTSKGEATVIKLAPFLRGINDLLFQNISRRDFETVSKFLTNLALNREYALTETRRTEKERASLQP